MAGKGAEDDGKNEQGSHGRSRLHAHELGAKPRGARDRRRKAGGRYWHLESDGSVVFGPTTINTTAPLNKLESDRYGAFVQGSLKF